MKKYTIFLFLFYFTNLVFSQNLDTLSTLDKVYDVSDLGLATTALFPDECLYYWCGIFTPAKTPCYINGVELAFAFEKYDLGSSVHDTLVLEVFQGDTTRNGLLKTYYPYKFDLGIYGFPYKFSSDIYSIYYSSIPSLMTLDLQPTKKIIQINEKYFIIGFRIKTKGKDDTYNAGSTNPYRIKWYGVNIGKTDLKQNNVPLKYLSRRYRINKVNQNSSDLQLAFTGMDRAIYMRTFVSYQKPQDNSISIINTSNTPVYDCDVITGVPDKINNQTVKDYDLSQNYPNPFNPGTSIKYEVPENCQVKIEIFNLTGQSIKILLDSKQSKGFYSVPFDASGLPSGTYFYKITATEGNKILFMETKRMLYLK